MTGRSAVRFLLGTLAALGTAVVLLLLGTGSATAADEPPAPDPAQPTLLGQVTEGVAQTLDGTVTPVVDQVRDDVVAPTLQTTAETVTQVVDGLTKPPPPKPAPPAGHAPADEAPAPADDPTPAAPAAPTTPTTPTSPSSEDANNPGPDDGSDHGPDHGDRPAQAEPRTPGAATGAPSTYAPAEADVPVSKPDAGSYVDQPATSSEDRPIQPTPLEDDRGSLPDPDPGQGGVPSPASAPLPVAGDLRGTLLPTDPWFSGRTRLRHWTVASQHFTRPAVSPA
jgi:hypothetical protein